jgi:hypothetical protein
MVINRLRPGFKMSKLLELQAWLEAGLVPFGMTESYGLAKFATRWGLRSKVTKELDYFTLTPDWDAYGLFYLIRPAMVRRYSALRKAATRTGTVEEYRRVQVDDIVESLFHRHTPIVMVDQGRYAPDASFPDGVLHWIVFKGYDGESFLVNDPDLGADIRLNHDQAEAAIDLTKFRTDRRLVEIW